LHAIANSNLFLLPLKSGRATASSVTKNSSFRSRKVRERNRRNFRGAVRENQQGVFGQGETLRVGLYARVSTHDQQTLPLQQSAMREYALRRGWSIVFQIDDIASGASDRPVRDEILLAAKRREIDLVLVWRLDRWGRSLVDLVNTMKELHSLGVGFVSLTEALDFTTPSGRAMAGMLAVFAEFERDILRDRVKAGIAAARNQGKPHGRPPSARNQVSDVRKLFSQGVSKRCIAKQLGIGRTSVRRLLAEPVSGS
jgi:putative DNA-invertase from lambdoid prophage Rac